MAIKSFKRFEKKFIITKEQYDKAMKQHEIHESKLEEKDKADEKIEEAKKAAEEISKAKEEAIINEELIFLVNEYSASASEIIVGALKDNNRAKIVGKTTYGKGVIQSVFMLDDGSSLKLTVNEYYTPNENKINKVGVTPDYEIELDYENEIDTQLNKAIELLK